MQHNLLKAKWTNFFSGAYSDAEWLCIKISVFILLGHMLIFPLFNRVDVPFPLGLCEWMDCRFALHPMWRWVMAGLIAAGLLAFLLEKKMFYITLFLFCSSMLVHSIEESQGNMGRAGLMSLVFLALFFAYALQRFGVSENVSRNRIQFVAQFIAGVYLLAACSKMSSAGWAWFTESPNVALQVLKSFDNVYFDTGDLSALQKGQATAAWISSHPVLVKLLFGSAIVLETCSFMLLGKKPVAFVYALLLFCMHLGIYQVLHILFQTISYPLIIFLINPLYILYLCGWSVRYLVRAK